MKTRGTIIHQPGVKGDVALMFQDDEAEDGNVYVVAEHKGITEPIARLSYRAQYAHVKRPVIILQVFGRSEGRRGEVTDTILVQPPRQEGDAGESTFCGDCGNKGWEIFNDNEIQRCDSCKRFGGDTDAVAHVMRQFEQLEQKG